MMLLTLQLSFKRCVCTTIHTHLIIWSQHLIIFVRSVQSANLPTHLLNARRIIWQESLNGMTESNVIMLILDVVTRWNSMYFMIERAYKYHMVCSHLWPFLCSQALKLMTIPDL